MNKLKFLLDKIFPSVPFDKKLHFIVGMLIAILAGFIIEPITGIGFV